MTEFDPTRHRMVPAQRWFENFVLGERFVIPSRTQTSAVFAAFQTASGDTHPIHYDVEYCRARGMPDLLAHGFQTLVHTAPGAGLFPHVVEESLFLLRTHPPDHDGAIVEDEDLGRVDCGGELGVGMSVY